MKNDSIILFLDFDGVLNNDRFLALHKNHVPAEAQELFDPNNVKALSVLCSGLPIQKIVITSTWRMDRSVDVLREMLSQAGFQSCDLVQDVTPILGHAFEARAEEIGSWLSHHGPIEVLILDDLDLSTNFAKGFFRVDAAVGLTMELVDEIVVQLSSRVEEGPGG